jgi:hypothetical protein
MSQIHGINNVNNFSVSQSEFLCTVSVSNIPYKIASIKCMDLEFWHVHVHFSCVHTQYNSNTAAIIFN